MEVGWGRGREKDMRMEAEFREERRCFTVAFEDGQRNRGPRKLSSLQKAEKVKKQTVPQSLQEACSPRTCLRLATSRTVRYEIRGALSRSVGGILLQKPVETNTLQKSDVTHASQ